MTGWLLKKIVKNSGEPSAHAAIGKFAGITGIVCNALLTAAKLIVGLLSGSVSVIADGVNNLSDAASSAVTLLGFRLAERPADRDHPYGHGRYEYLAGTVIAALILSIGVELGKTSLQKIFRPEPVFVTVPVAIVLLLSVAVKLWLSRFYNSLGGHIGSETLKASAADSRNDVISTLAVLAGCAVTYFFDINVDGYVGLAVAAFIVYSGIGIAKDAVSPLLGRRADKGLTDEIVRIITSHDKVLGMHDLLVHDYGPGRRYASAHVEIRADEDVILCHELIDKIEREVAEMTGVDTVLHYDPVVTDDDEQNRAMELVGSVVNGIDPEYTMHDFRLIREAGKKTLEFDISVPFTSLDRRERIKEMIDDGIAESGGDYETKIRFDGK